MQVKRLLFALPLMLWVFGLYQSYLLPHRMEQCIQGIEFAVILIAIIIVCGILHEMCYPQLGITSAFWRAAAVKKYMWFCLRTSPAGRQVMP